MGHSWRRGGCAAVSWLKRFSRGRCRRSYCTFGARKRRIRRKYRLLRRWPPMASRELLLLPARTAPRRCPTTSMPQTAPRAVPVPDVGTRRGPRGVAPRPDVDAANGENVPYKLFRFVDLDPELQPGHVYKYRVSMLLRNPNFGLQPQVLLKPDATRLVTYRATPWSDTSPAISIPESTRLLGGSIDRPRHQEPKAKIGVFTFDKVQAIELIKEFDTEMGGLVGTGPDQTVKDVADPVKRAGSRHHGQIPHASGRARFPRQR